MLGTPLHRIEVADGRPTLQASGRPNRPGGTQKCLGQAGFTRSRLADESDGSDDLNRWVRCGVGHDCSPCGTARATHAPRAWVDWLVMRKSVRDWAGQGNRGLVTWSP